jgi:single-strand DNA-binding protein
MSQDNQITLRGYLTAEPKLHQKTATAIPVTEIRVGSTPRRLNRETGEWLDAPTSYYTVKCWRRLAINAVSSLHKGDMVVIRGRFYMNNWVDNQQQQRSTLEIEADSLGHDLAYGWSHFLRGTRPQPGRAEGVNAGEVARQDTGPSEPDGGDDYFAGGYAGEPQGTAFASGDEAGQGYPGFVGDPLDGASDAWAASDGTGGPAVTAESAEPVGSAEHAISMTEGDGFGATEPEDVLAAAGLIDDASLPEPEAVPF